MIEQKIPLFSSGNLLTQDMLECMKEYMLCANELNVCGYSDGVLCGCEIHVSDTHISVGKGILVYEEVPFLVTKPIWIKYRPTNETLILRAVVGDVERTDNFLIRQLTMDLVDTEKLREKDIELCRFRLQNGAVLRDQYHNYMDMQTEYDTLNFIFAKWSAKGRTSISPIVLQEFKREAIKHSMESEFDQMFCWQIMNGNGRTINREALEFYIARSLGYEYKKLTNEEIYQELANVLAKMKKGYSPNRGNIRRSQRIIVD